MSTHAEHGSTTTGAGDAPTAGGAQAAVERVEPTTGADVRHDRIRWSAVWTGALTTLTTNIVLQLLFFSLGWLDLGTGSSTTALVVSGVLGLVAFLLGGIAAGASALWRRVNDGMVNGIVSWALTTVLLLAIALAGGGALVGYFGNVFGGFGTIGGPADVGLARQTAGWAVLGLGLSVVASALGGTVGAKIWPGRGKRDADRR
ncbi:hypothetical protein ACL02T_01270 [Pseudonocardia sp. RS010]|uniref:hypothetical protein n=1 Tax=Pseudonocardia sp. RS010 TaxID=3385979 RepID=UPI0039A30B06